MTKKELEKENEELKSELESWRKGDLISCGMQNFERLYISLKHEHKDLKDDYIKLARKLTKYLK